MRGLPSEPIGEKIHNMEELLKEHARMREMDVKLIPIPQTMNGSSQPVNGHNLSTPKLKILDEINFVA